MSAILGALSSLGKVASNASTAAGSALSISAPNKGKNASGSPPGSPLSPANKGFGANLPVVASTAANRAAENLAKAANGTNATNATTPNPPGASTRGGGRRKKNKSKKNRSKKNKSRKNRR